MARPTDEEALGAIRALAGLGGLDRAALAAVARRRALAAGETLQRQGDAGAGLIGVVSGELHVGITAASGRRVLLAILRAGASYPGGPLDGGPSPVAVLAERDSDVLVIAPERLEEVVRARPEVALAFARLLDRRLERVTERVGQLALHSVDHTVAAFLARQARAAGCADAGPHTLTRDLTTETLAARLGTAREELSRSLRRLADRGLIDMSREEVEIRDVDALEEVGSLHGGA